MNPDTTSGFFIMSDKPNEFLFEYQYQASPEVEERFNQAMDIILALILEDYENEQKENARLDGEQC